MQLLVSVRDSLEAAAALAGGADVIDGKDPTRGALGAVSISTFEAIRDACAGRVPVTAALGDRLCEHDVEVQAAAFSIAGACLLKVGFAEALAQPGIERIILAACRGASTGGVSCGVVAVAYADAARVAATPANVVLEAAARAGAAGVLLDTADKVGPGLRHLITEESLARWVEGARRAQMLVAVAGRLTADDLEWLVPFAADIIGVRGAACEVDRASAVSAAKVSMLRAHCEALFQPTPSPRLRPTGVPA